MESAIAIGTNIYRHRKESHLTQDDLARHLGVTKASVSKWETGQSYPDIELLPKLATYFAEPDRKRCQQSCLCFFSTQPRFKRVVKNHKEITK